MLADAMNAIEVKRTIEFLDGRSGMARLRKGYHITDHCPYEWSFGRYFINVSYEFNGLDGTHHGNCLVTSFGLAVGEFGCYTTH